MFTLVQTFTIYVIGSTDVKISERYAMYEPSDLIAILRKIENSIDSIKNRLDSIDNRMASKTD